MKQDTIHIEILPDGTIKTTTDAVSGANHANAESFMKELARLTDGKMTRDKRKPAHHHGHTHGHTHSH